MKNADTRYCHSAARIQDKDVILYHGTSAACLDGILQEGILPRRLTGRKSNWNGKVRSKPGFVYLTTAYPVYYAHAAADADDADLAIIKVDAGEAELYPDEDFVARALWALYERKARLQDFNPSIDQADFKDMWKACLQYNGTACTPCIPASRIIDYKTISKTNIDLIWDIGADALPIPDNYEIYGRHFERCIDALFRGGEEAAWRIVRELDGYQDGEGAAFVQAA